MNIKQRVIIWGVDDYNTLALIRQVGQIFSDVFFLVVGKAHYAARSKYCTKYIETATLKDGMHYMLNVLSNSVAKPIIITNGDDIITFIDRHRNELEESFVLPGCRRQGNTEWFIDKFNMTCLAAECGIDVPKSWLITKESCVDDVIFPCFIKPSHQKLGHYNEFKFKFCQTRRDLKETLKYVREDSIFIVQQFIKKEKDLLVYGCRMPDGKVEIAGGLVTDRFAVGQGSSYGRVSAKVHPSIDCEKIVRFLERTDYIGLFSFEYGLMNDVAYFFEVNFRNDGTSHFFFNAGANLPCAYALASSGLPYDEVPVKVKIDCSYMDEVFDICNVLLRKVTLSEWKKQRQEVKAYKFFDKDDIIPYTIAKKNKWVRILRDIFIKKYRLYILFVIDRLGFRKS